MALQKDIRSQFESVVGPENISDDQAVLRSYMYQPFGARKGVWADIPPAAVLMPGSTEEVVDIVKICNRHRIVFKAMSTGWGMHNLPGVEGAVSLDLRRMNRILEIDEKNMYAVVEPHVICAQLQVEAMRKGLNCHIIGAGANTSVLASATSVAGYGPCPAGIVRHRGRMVLRRRAGTQPARHNARLGGGLGRTGRVHEVRGQAVPLERPH